MAQTAHFGLEKPDIERNVDEEFYLLQDTLDALDGILKNFQDAIAGKASSTHGHSMDAISGLAAALAAKMPGNQTFRLDDLTDVDGADIAPAGYVLVKTASGWLPSSAVATLGEHGHTIGQITGLTGVLLAKADAQATATALAARMPVYGAEIPLPATNVGPIWHDAYASVMTWQTFASNGASYAGYASVDVGRPSVDGQPTQRAGRLRRNGASVSKTTYAALWNWALHNGRVVTLGSWSAGPFVFADNGNGTFRLPDNRGEFERLWDDGRGVDTGRAMGTAQSSQNLEHGHGVNDPGHAHDYARFNSVGNADDGGSILNAWAGTAIVATVPATTGITIQSSGGSEARPRNVALLGDIKF